MLVPPPMKRAPALVLLFISVLLGCSPVAPASANDAGEPVADGSELATDSGFSVDAGEDGGGSRDSGSSEDAGPSDAAVRDSGTDVLGCLIDAGFSVSVPSPVTGGVVGDECSMSDGGQGSCSSGLRCRSLTLTGSYCTAACATDAECGTSGSIQNVCLTVGGGQGYCTRGCVPGIDGGCGRDDFTCLRGGGAGGLCIQDCRRLGGDQFCHAFQYGEICNNMHGFCWTKICNTSTDCADGQVCARNGPAAGQCVADCRTACLVCPTATACDPSSGSCH
jgi:hypothetical protein